MVKTVKTPRPVGGRLRSMVRVENRALLVSYPLNQEPEARGHPKWSLTVGTIHEQSKRKNKKQKEINKKIAVSKGPWAPKTNSLLSEYSAREAEQHGKKVNSTSYEKQAEVSVSKS